MVTNVDDDSQLWNFHLYHTSYGSLRHMIHLCLDEEGLPQIKPPSSVCKGCVIVNITKGPFQKTTQGMPLSPFN